MYGSHRLRWTKFLPLFAQRRWRKVGITFGRLMKFSRCVPHKKRIPPTQRSDDFVGWNGGKMNRVCCGAVDLSGIIHGEAVFKMNTTTSCGWFWTNPQNQWDLWQRISRIERCVKIIWKKYCGKAVIVGLIGDCLSCFFIYSYNDSHWGIVIGQGWKGLS